VVRLKEGDPNRQTHYSTDPAGTPGAGSMPGTRWLHVVNLDGAFDQAESPTSRAAGSGAQPGSRRTGPVWRGMRSLEAIEAALKLGAARVVLGTLAVEQPQILAEALARWGAEQIAVSLDARDGRVQVRGWQNDTPLLAVELAFRCARAGCAGWSSPILPATDCKPA
jgi:phosphoribosylformimino-5-aminoimidazole carboxamide ribotide isomerase